VLLIAGLGLFYKNLAGASLFLSGLFYVLSGLAAYLLGRMVLGRSYFALPYALAVIFTGRLLWTAGSGMEGTLFSFLCLSAVLAYFRGKDLGKFSVTAGMLFGLAANARPEGFLLFIFAVTDWVFLQKIGREKKIRVSTVPWLAGAAFALLAMPYPIFSYLIGGHFTPNTFRATHLPFAWPRSVYYFKLSIQLFYHDHLLLYMALPVGVAVFLGRLWGGAEDERRQLLIWLWPLGYLAVSSLVAPIIFHFERYMIPVLPFFVLLSFYGWQWILEKGKRWIGPKYLPRVQVALAMIMILWAGFMTLYFWPILTSLCVKNINDMQVKLGSWVRDNTRPRDVIAANDIGAIFYLSERPALDLVGLVNPELLVKVRGLKIPSPARDQITFEYLREKKPDYLVVFPSWFPSMINRTEYFEPVYSITIPDDIICPSDTMTVYKCHWPLK
jgi:hypothetical protein